jgi:hypothetical protein
LKKKPVFLFRWGKAGRGRLSILKPEGLGVSRHAGTGGPARVLVKEGTYAYQDRRRGKPPKNLIPLPQPDPSMRILNVKTALLLVLVILLAVPAVALVPPGRITVSSTPPGAVACIDNKVCDTTDATFMAEGNAWHTVVVSEKGYRDWASTVFVTSDQISRVDASLDLNGAATAIYVSLIPGSGTVCLDNSQCQAGVTGGTGNMLFTSVSPGYHTLSVRSPAGYRDTTELVQVTLGKSIKVSITLDPVVIPTTATTAPPPATLITPVNPATGNIRVYVDRTGSTICIDIVDCFVNVGGTPGTGTGTTIFNEVTANVVHTISVTADGYQPISANVSVGKDLISTVDIKLQPLGNATTAPMLIPTPLPTEPAPRSTRAGLDVLPLIGALALCGAVFLFRKEGQ